MALNPSYVQQTTRALPFCLGYVYAQGDLISSIVGFDGATAELYVLADGEWESNLFLSVSPTDWYSTDGATLLGGDPAIDTNKFNAGDNYSRNLYYHFHGGSYATKGLPNNQIGSGPDQGVEMWTRYFPSITPTLAYSGLAYYMVRRIISPLAYTGDVAATSTQPMNPVGCYRTLKCRMFDAAGNVTGYGFTVNPTWQMIETLLRYQIKRQQPGLSGLTAAERACFDWPAMVAHAARNAELMTNGAPTYAGNFTFAADASLATMMETQMRNCRSYKRVRGGQIAFIGDDPRTSVFTFSQRLLVPGSVQISKKDLSTSPNVYVPQFRDLGIPAVCEVATVASVLETIDGSTGYLNTFTTVGPQPLYSEDNFTYSGGSDDADFAGEYEVRLYTQTVAGVTSEIAPPISNQFNTSSGPQKAATATGGYIGTQQSRFSQRAPTVVQHRAHQRAIGQIAPGITPLPRATPVQYDLGNNTFDQTNRIMQFMISRDLGLDVANWIAPFKGSISGFLEAIDVNGAALLEVEEGDFITLDDTATADFSGVYEVTEKTVNPAKYDGRGAKIDLVFQSPPPVFPATSYPPGDSYQTLPNSLLPMADTPGITIGTTATFATAVTVPFWVMKATPAFSAGSGGTVTVTVPDLSIWWQGQTAPTLYSAITLTGVPLSALVTVYLLVTAIGTTPTMRVDSTNTEIPLPLPAGNFVLFYGEVLGVSGSFNAQAAASYLGGTAVASDSTGSTITGTGGTVAGSGGSGGPGDGGGGSTQ